MKATKEIMDRAQALYAEYGHLMAEGENRANDAKCVSDEYNTLLEQYDFDNEVYTDTAGHEGVKTSCGEVWIPAKYDRVRYFTLSGVPAVARKAIAFRNGQDRLINRQGREVFHADAICPDGPAFGTALYRDGDKWGMVSAKGEIILPAEYDSVKPDSNGFIFLERDGKSGFVANGHIVEPKFDSVEIDADDRLAVTLDGRHGYVDEADAFTADPDAAYYRFDMFL